MKMLIVAGGQGTRLRPLTNNLPKPMVMINDKPILEHIVLHAKKYGITEFIFALCYLPEKITEYFGDGKKWDVKIEYTFEDQDKPMGSAGALIEAKRKINETCIVTYADIIRDLNISEMMKQHNKTKAQATINVYKRLGENPKSKIDFGDNKKITSFTERPEKIEEDFVWANGSFYILEPEIMKMIPEDRPSDFGHDIFPKIINENISMYAFPTEGYFIDIGTKEKLTKAQDYLRSHAI